MTLLSAPGRPAACAERGRGSPRRAIGGEKYPGMQMVSFGPTIVDPHSPNERVQISSVESFWNYLKLVLESL